MSPFGVCRYVLCFAVAVAAAYAAELDHSNARRSGTGLGRPLPAGWNPAVMDAELHSLVAIQRAEFRTGELPDAAVLEAEGWFGGDYQRFWWKLNQEQLLEAPKSGELEVEALYGRLISPFWDVVAGVRFDRAYSGPEMDSRGHAVVGLRGLAPYRIEVEPTLALSDRGDLSFEFTGTYDLLITQQLILQPRVDLRFDSAKAERSATFLGEGLNDLDLGLRLRYDLRRTFSPYVGIEWHRPLGASSAIARRVGKGGWRSAFVIGLRTWF